MARLVLVSTALACALVIASCAADATVAGGAADGVDAASDGSASDGGGAGPGGPDGWTSPDASQAGDTLPLPDVARGPDGSGPWDANPGASDADGTSAPDGGGADGGGEADVAELPDVTGGDGWDGVGGPDGWGEPDVQADTQWTDALGPDAQWADAGADAQWADAGADALSPDAGPDALTPDAGTDALAPDAAGGAGGTPCAAHESCGSSACVWTPEGRVCAAPCADGCEDGTACGEVAGQAVCVLPAVTLCQPCTGDADCTDEGDTGARCIAGGAGGDFCGTSCDAGAPCPDGQDCVSVTTTAGDAASQCVPAVGSSCACNGWGAAVAAATDCTPPGAPGCAGMRSCAPSPDDGAPTLSACAAIDAACAADQDKDGWCISGAAPTGGCQPGDCDDGDPGIHPGATEGPSDGVDQDCDGQELCYVDADKDGFRAATTALAPGMSCDTADGLAPASAALDCDDGDAAVWPGAVELSDDGVDSDCDGLELFDGHPLTLTGPIGGPAFMVGVSGDFPMEPFGAVPVTGAVERAAAGAPVTWCISGPVTYDFGPFQLAAATATICRTGDTSPTVITISGTVAAGGLLWPVTGTAQRTSPHDVLLQPTGVLPLRGADFLIVEDPAKSAFRMDPTPSWQVTAQRELVTLGAGIAVADAVATVDADGVALAGTVTLGSGDQAVSLDANGSYGLAGPYELALAAPGASVLPFTAQQLPLGVRALDPAGTIAGDDDGATAVIASSHLCAGDCCAPHGGGGCEVPDMAACPADASCAQDWGSTCVAALATCDLHLASGYALHDPTLTVTVSAAAPWDAVLSGTALPGAFPSLALPAHQASSRVDGCRDPQVRQCACAADAACCDGWSEACAATACEVARCGDGALFMHAVLPDPLAVLPDGALTLHDTVLDTWFVDGAPAAATWGAAALCLDAACPGDLATAPLGTTLPEHGAKVVEAAGALTPTGSTFVAALGSATLPPFLAAPAALVVRTGDATGPLDVFHTDAPEDDIEAGPGLTLAVFGTAAIAAPHFTSALDAPLWTATWALDPEAGAFKIEALAHFDWLIVPDGALPATAVTLSAVVAHSAISVPALATAAFAPDAPGPFDGAGAGATLIIDADATLSAAEPLTGTARLVVEPDADGGIAGGTLWLTGAWREPLGVRDVAVVDPTATLYVAAATGEPLALAMTQLALQRPPGCDWPEGALTESCLVPTTLQVLARPGGALLATLPDPGDGIPRLLGDLGAAWKASLDPQLAQNALAAWAAQLAQAGLGAAGMDPALGPAEMPALALPDAALQPFGLTVAGGQVAVASATTERVGDPHSAGVTFTADATGPASGTWRGGVELDGFLTPKSVQAAGSFAPFPIDAIQLTADPFDRILVMAGGALTIPDGEALLPTPVEDAQGAAVQRCVEAWVQKGEWSPDEPATLYRKADDIDGLVVTLVRLGPTDAPPETRFPALDVAATPIFDAAGVDPGAERAWIVVEVRNGGAARTYQSERGVVPAGGWHHVGVSLRGAEAVAEVDGRAVPLTATGPAIELGATSAGIVVGEGLDAMDELRLWRRARPVGLLASRARILAPEDEQSPDLLLRLPFDWDMGAVAHDVRGLPDAPHVGTLTGGAHTEAVTDGEVHVRAALDLTSPGAGWGAEALSGASVQLSAAVPDWEVRVRLPSTPGASAQFWGPQWPAYTFGSLGALRITGPGLNGTQGDSDDVVTGTLHTDRTFTAASPWLEFVPAGLAPELQGPATMDFGCPNPPTPGADPCPAPPGQTTTTYRLVSTGPLDITFPTSGVRLAGQATMKLSYGVTSLLVSGVVESSAWTMQSSAISSSFDDPKLYATAPVALGVQYGRDLGSPDVNVIWDLVTGGISFARYIFLDFGGVSHGCNVEGTIDGAGTHVTKFDCSGYCWADEQCPGAGSWCSGWKCQYDTKKSLGEECLLDQDCYSGFCDLWATIPPQCATPLEDGIGCVQPGQCKSGNCGYRPGNGQKVCYTPGTRLLGEECVDVLECKEGECWGTLFWPAHCLCTTNAQCAASSNAPAGSICKLGSWGVTAEAGLCVPKLGAGEACTATSECQDGAQCSGGVCIWPASTYNWESCSSDAECLHGKCYSGVCRCVSNADCSQEFGSSWYCDMGDWLPTNQEGKCHNEKYPSDTGAWCEDGNWCVSGMCAYSTNLVHSTCYSYAGFGWGHWCDVDQQCASGVCQYWWFNTCQ